MQTHNAIAVFDSGAGGLSVLKALRAHLPLEKFFYLADYAFFPYGDKEEAAIQQRVLFLGKKIEETGAKLLVVACNTATAAAADILRLNLKIPVVAIEPAIKPAAQKSKRGVVVLATSATLKSKRFLNLCARFQGKTQFIFTPCPGLVEAIESHNAFVLKEKLDELLLPLQIYNPDGVVLGCTHYPWIKNEIAAYFQKDVWILETGFAIARQVERKLLHKGQKGEVFFAATEHTEKLQHQLECLGFGQKTVHLWRI